MTLITYISVLFRAESGTKGKKNAKYRPNPLDRTIVHPESYEVAER